MATASLVQLVQKNYTGDVDMLPLESIFTPESKTSEAPETSVVASDE